MRLVIACSLLFSLALGQNEDGTVSNEMDFAESLTESQSLSASPSPIDDSYSPSLSDTPSEAPTPSETPTLSDPPSITPSPSRTRTPTRSTSLSSSPTRTPTPELIVQQYHENQAVRFLHALHIGSANYHAVTIFSDSSYWTSITYVGFLAWFIMMVVFGCAQYWFVCRPEARAKNISTYSHKLLSDTSSARLLVALIVSIVILSVWSMHSFEMMREATADSIQDITNMNDLINEVARDTEAVVQATEASEFRRHEIAPNCTHILNYTTKFDDFTAALYQFSNQTAEMVNSLHPVETPLHALKAGLRTFESVPFVILVISVFAGFAGLLCSDLDVLRVFKFCASYFILFGGCVFALFFSWSVVMADFCVSPESNAQSLIKRGLHTDTEYYYATCATNADLWHELADIEAKALEVRALMYDLVPECNSLKMEELVSDLSWIHGSLERLQQTMSCQNFLSEWENLCFAHLCDDLTTSSLRLDLSLMLSVPCYVAAIFIIHHHSRNVRMWRVASPIAKPVIKTEHKPLLDTTASPAMLPPTRPQRVRDRMARLTGKSGREWAEVGDENNSDEERNDEEQGEGSGYQRAPVSVPKPKKRI